MESSPQKHSEATELNLGFFSISPTTLLQISTVPVLVAVLGGKVFSETLQAIGEASEEVFRGDRLPVLKFPIETESELS